MRWIAAGFCPEIKPTFSVKRPAKSGQKGYKFPLEGHEIKIQLE
jgi:hypothetical protein